MTATEKSNQIVTNWFIRNNLIMNGALTISDFYGLIDDFESELKKASVSTDKILRFANRLVELGIIKSGDWAFVCGELHKAFLIYDKTTSPS